MDYIIFALASYIGWAVGDIFGVVAARKLGGFSASLWSYILRVIIFSFYIPFVLKYLAKLTPDLLLINVVLGLVLLTGFISFNQALKIGNPALVGAIAASFSALVVILSLIFLGERITSRQMLAILVIFLGVFLATFDLRTFLKTRIIPKGVILALVAMVAWGIYFTFIKIPVREIGWFWPNYISFTLFPVVFLFMKLKKIRIYPINFKGAIIPLVLAAILTGVAEFSFNYAISRGLTAIVAPVAGSYPTLYVLLAFLVFKEPLAKQQIVGIITTLIGIVLLSFFSV